VRGTLVVVVTIGTVTTVSTRAIGSGAPVVVVGTWVVDVVVLCHVFLNFGVFGSLTTVTGTVVSTVVVGSIRYSVTSGTVVAGCCALLRPAFAKYKAPAAQLVMNTDVIT
jgi:hypothetical protein